MRGSTVGRFTTTLVPYQPLARVAIRVGRLSGLRVGVRHARRLCRHAAHIVLSQHPTSRPRACPIPGCYNHLAGQTISSNGGMIV